MSKCALMPGLNVALSLFLAISAKQNANHTAGTGRKKLENNHANFGMF